MILGLFLDGVGIPVIPMILMILSGLIQIAGFAYLIFKYNASKGSEVVDPALFAKITKIAGYVFIIYAVLELIAAAACICANDACRGGYHYPVGTPCVFCNGSGAGTHSGASDRMTLGIYFDAFIVNSFIVAAIETVKGFIADRAKD